MVRENKYRNENHGFTGTQSFTDKTIPFQKVDDSATPELDETGGRVNDYLDNDADFFYDKDTQTENVVNVESQNEHINNSLDVSARDANDNEIPADSVNINADDILITSDNDVTINAGNLTDNEKKVNITSSVTEVNELDADKIVVDKTDGKTIIDSTGVQTNELITYGDAHIKGNLYVDGTGIETVSTELKVGSDIIEIRNGNSAPIQDYAGLVINNYDGVHNSGLMEDNTGTVMVGNISTSSTVIYTQDGNTFYTDVELTTTYTPDPLDKLRNTQNLVPDTDIQIWEAYQITSSDMVPLTGRDDEANMVDDKIVKWDADDKVVKTTDYSTDDFVQQVYEMPDATSEEYIGKSVVYIGDTDANYTNGCLYVSDTTVTPDSQENSIEISVSEDTYTFVDTGSGVSTGSPSAGKTLYRSTPIAVQYLKPCIYSNGYEVYAPAKSTNNPLHSSYKNFRAIFTNWSDPYEIDGNYSLYLYAGKLYVGDDSGISLVVGLSFSRLDETVSITIDNTWRSEAGTVIYTFASGSEIVIPVGKNIDSIYYNGNQITSIYNGITVGPTVVDTDFLDVTYTSLLYFGTVTAAWKAQTVPIAEVADLVYPVGSWYYTQDRAFNPNTVWLGQTWEKVYDKQADIARENVYWKTMNNFTDATYYNKMFYSGSPSVVLGDPDDALDYEGMYTDHNHPETIGTVIGTNWMKTGQVAYHEHVVPQRYTTSGEGAHEHTVRSFTSTTNDANYGTNETKGLGVPFTSGSNYGYYQITYDGYGIISGSSGTHQHSIAACRTSEQWTDAQGNAYDDDNDYYYYDDYQTQPIGGVGDNSYQGALEPMRTKRMVVYAWRRTA